jgi:SAM-dependent methyltransferase
MSGPLTAAQANRRFYEQVAATYDAAEHCVIDPRLRQRLRLALESALALAPGRAVLDACGGSGHASGLLAELGVPTVLVDVSAEMVARWRARAGPEVEAHVEEIESFLAGDQRRWDLIVFSSALHHLQDPRAVLERAVGRLTPGGVLLTVFDPPLTDALGRWLRRLDAVLHRLVVHPRAFAGWVAVKLRRRAQPANDEHWLGRLAEVHAVDGLDDGALREVIERLGAEVISHQRTFDARLRPIGRLQRRLGRPSAFSLLVRAQRPAATAREATS